MSTAAHRLKHMESSENILLLLKNRFKKTKQRWKENPGILVKQFCHIKCSLWTFLCSLATRKVAHWQLDPMCSTLEMHMGNVLHQSTTIKATILNSVCSLIPPYMLVSFNLQLKKARPPRQCSVTCSGSHPRTWPGTTSWHLPWWHDAEYQPEI